MGKTSVVDEVARRLAASSIGFDVVRLKGLEAEVEMAWSGSPACSTVTSTAYPRCPRDEPRRSTPPSP